MEQQRNKQKANQTTNMIYCSLRALVSNPIIPSVKEMNLASNLAVNTAIFSPKIQSHSTPFCIGFR